MKIYIRYKEYSYEGQEILFPTTDRERAFTMTDEDKAEEYFFEGDNQYLSVYEDGKRTETYRWDVDVKEFQRAEY